MSPKNIENISNFEGRGLILVACKKSCIQEKIRNSVLGFSRRYYYKPVLILEIFFLDISYYNFFRFLSPLNTFFYINKLKRRQKKKKLCIWPVSKNIAFTALKPAFQKTQHWLYNHLFCETYEKQSSQTFNSWFCLKGTLSGLRHILKKWCKSFLFHLKSSSRFHDI